jgi:IgGFc binding protein
MRSGSTSALACLAGALGVFGVLGALGACGDSGGSGPENPPDAGAGASSAGGAGGSGGILLPDAGSDAPSGYGCSADLRSVVDANGVVVATCPPDQGCADGVCVPACQAAAESHGNVGCDFLVPTPPAYQTTLAPCFAVALANTWAQPATVSVSRAGSTFDVTQFARIPVDGAPPEDWPAVPASGIPVDEVAVLFLSADPNSVFPENNVPMSCPVPTAVGAATLLEGSGFSDAFVLTSDTPLSAYDILPFGGAQSHFPSAELLFPMSAWGTNYVVIATPPGTHAPPGPLWGQILAGEDGTSVQIVATADLPAAGTVPATPTNQLASFTLDAGQYVQWQLDPGQPDLSGSVVLADKPVAVFAGNRFYRQQPVPGPGGESTHQQVQAISALGHTYVGAPFATRRQDQIDEPIRYRFVGVADGTLLSYEPAIAGAPASLARGDVIDFLATGPFRASSQDADHPFAAAQMMDTANVPSGSVPGASEAYCATFGFGPMLGDEEFVVMLPPAQYLSKYVFFTDPTYSTTHLALTRVKTATGFADVSVDCLGTVTGWQPVGSDGAYEVAAVDLVRGGVGVASCQNGRHVAESEGPFGVVVWGLDCYSSYAYSAGGNAASLTTLSVPPTPR